MNTYSIVRNISGLVVLFGIVALVVGIAQAYQLSQKTSQSLKLMITYQQFGFQLVPKGISTSEAEKLIQSEIELAQSRCDSFLDPFDNDTVNYKYTVDLDDVMRLSSKPRESYNRLVLGVQAFCPNVFKEVKAKHHTKPDYGP